ncbi:hypothetical protein XENTR_v10015862 [Xenopus tropicalis]|uniref:Dynein 2 intermediate chain 1 n=1 Tax=Xenopus tropicalis TaxID=8364 RepID=A0A6I8PTC1_XENTR|nr:WD repeat-containing protein 60 [Xenopus tropicalis]KAE8595737.1 hypothetical protein XENTR_v10015862 [Xenopus tropicalis]
MSSATQHDRSKNKEDTWKSEELKRHLKASQPDDRRQKERRHHRNEDREENVQSKQKYNDREKKEEQEHRGTRESERYRDKDMDILQNDHGEKDKGRDYDRDHKREKYKSGERKHSAEEMRKSYGVSKDYVSAQLERDKSLQKRRDVRGGSDKHKQEDYDKEKRHRERREKEEKRSERGYDEDREQRHRKHRKELDTEDLDRERRRSERKHGERATEDADRERRRSEQKHKERSSEDVDVERRKSERKHKEVSSEDVDRERRRSERKHRERSKEDADRERRRSERKHRERSTEDEGRERSEQKHKERSSENVDEERRKSERKTKELSSEDVDWERRRERKHREKYLEDASVDGERRRREGKHGEIPAENVDWTEQKHWERSPREERHQRRSEKQSSETKKPPLPKEKIMDERERKHREIKNRQGHPEESENEGSADQAFSTDQANEDSTNYEEDFEDYDDDFENDSENETEEMEEPERNPEIEAIQRAMILENEKIASFPPAPKRKDGDEKSKQEPGAAPVREPHRGVFIDFVSAKQRQVNCQIASKQKKRSTEILRLVDLDFSTTLSLLDLHPVKEYEMYIRNFGRTNTKQAYVQCNEDNVDRDVQTEDIDFEEKWTQHPGEGAVASGGQKNDASQKMMTVTKIDSQRLTNFLQSACQVIAVLLEEDRAEKQSDWNVQSKEPCMSISNGCFQLNTSLPFLQARPVYHLHFSPTQRHMLLTVHGLCKDPGIVHLDNSYIICVWNVWEPSTPQKVLVCDAEVKCCCFSPGRAALVFAGTIDGTVAVWDLREDPALHHTMKIADTSWTFRAATFSTDGVFDQQTHTCSVRAIEPLSSAAAKDHGMSLLSSQEEVSGFSFQIASLDESAHLILWVVVELRKVDWAGSQNDLGLIPGGKIKLSHSASIRLGSNFFSKDVLSLGVPETLNIKFLPQDSNHFFTGTDIGIVARGTRYGLAEPPKQYKPRHGKLRPSKITAIDFSPFSVPAFLAGCSDGCIRLHSLHAEFPIMQWSDSTSGHSVTALQWSLTRPTVFFVLDAACCIYIWDLMQNDLQPVAKDSVQSDQVLCMATLGEPEKNSSLTGLALAKASGKVDIQYVKKIWTKCQTGEMEKLQLLLQEIL